MGEIRMSVHVKHLDILNRYAKNACRKNSEVGIAKTLITWYDFVARVHSKVTYRGWERSTSAWRWYLWSKKGQTEGLFTI